MAGSALLEREIEKITGETAELASGRVSEEEREHRSRMSQNFRDLFEAPEASVYHVHEEERAREERRYYTEDRHDPVVPASPDAPSASHRIADYLAASRTLQDMRERADETSYASAPEAFAPEAFAPEAYAPAPEMYAPEAYESMEQEEEYIPYEEYLYQEGILMDASLAPERETKEAPVFSPSYMPEAPVLPDEDDCRPTRRTLEYRYEDEAEDSKEMRAFAGLSARTKAILGAVAAAVVLLLAIICINTAILKSINSGVALREGTVQGLSETLTNIVNEIEGITSPEYVENWAAEHGMTPPES